MREPQILLSFVGNHDPLGDLEGNYGPVLSLLQARRFDHVFLFWTDSRFLTIAKEVEARAAEFTDPPRFHFIPIELESVIDYVELFQKMEGAVRGIKTVALPSGASWSVLLDPGTPQMQTCWFLLVKAGILPALLLQGVPPRFTGGAYKVREIDLDHQALPEVAFPGKETLLAGLRSADLSPGDEYLTSESPAMRTLYDKALNAARYDTTVLLEGETGTGKEVLARAIHRASRRSNESFHAVNCASIPANLAESVFFGHVKGAFTGAVDGALGHFRTAHGGTLFLDEIGELPPEIQPKLLRCLDNHEIHPVGAQKPEKVDVRIIAATNRDLYRMVAEGTFREDLYQRLNEVYLKMIPLRDRREDIPLFLHRFMQDWNSKYSEDRSLSRETLDLLVSYPWPRNIRQLKGAVKQMCSLSRAQELTPGILPDEILRFHQGASPHTDLTQDLPEEGLDLKALLYQVEARYYRLALDRSGGNAEKAAGLLGLNPHSFRKALRERIRIEE